MGWCSACKTSVDTFWWHPQSPAHPIDNAIPLVSRQCPQSGSWESLDYCSRLAKRLVSFAGRVIRSASPDYFDKTSSAVRHAAQYSDRSVIFVHFLDFPNDEVDGNYVVAYQGCCKSAAAKIYVRSGPAAYTDPPSSRIVSLPIGMAWCMGCIQDVTQLRYRNVQ